MNPGVPYAKMKSVVMTAEQAEAIRQVKQDNLECFMTHPIGCLCRLWLPLGTEPPTFIG